MIDWMLLRIAKKENSTYLIYKWADLTHGQGLVDNCLVKSSGLRSKISNSRQMNFSWKGEPCHLTRSREARIGEANYKGKRAGGGGSKIFYSISFYT